MQPTIRLFVSVSIIALQPSRESYTGLPSATTILSSDTQPLKALGSISVTAWGIMILLTDAQFDNVAYSIEVSDSERVIFLSDVHLSKALFPRTL